MSRYPKGSKGEICPCGKPRYSKSSSCLCYECHLQRNQEAWRRWQDSMTPEEKQAHLDRVKQNQLKAKLKQFGLTLEDYQSVLISQGFSCGICLSKDPGGKGRWHIDHDHITGKFRGLLCHSCNTGLGSFKDSVSNLQRAINYLGLAYGLPLQNQS